MRVLVTGVKGQLGHDVCARLSRLGIENKGVDIEDFDLTDAVATRDAVRAYAPTHVVHCGAYTAVDKAEAERDLCMRINEGGTANIAAACRDTGAEMMYFSTDYVFDGFSRKKPWEVEDQADPQSVYGLSKYAGEQAVREALDAHYILRISWVFGKNGRNFIRTMLDLASKRDEITVVCDQFGAPTYTQDLAVLVCDMLPTGKYGTYHAPNEGMTSWYDFAKEIFAATGKDVLVTPVLTSEYPAAARRPENSRLSTRSLREAGFGTLPHYHDALLRYLREIGELK